jgi:hypothetical protein
MKIILGILLAADIALGQDKPVYTKKDMREDVKQLRSDLQDAQERLARLEAALANNQDPTSPPKKRPLQTYDDCVDLMRAADHQGSANCFCPIAERERGNIKAAYNCGVSHMNLADDATTPAEKCPHIDEAIRWLQKVQKQSPNFEHVVEDLKKARAAHLDYCEQ